MGRCGRIAAERAGDAADAEIAASAAGSRSSLVSIPAPANEVPLRFTLLQRCPGFIDRRHAD